MISVMCKEIKIMENVMVVLESVCIKQIKDVLLKTFHVNYLIVLKLHQDIIL